MNSVGFFIGDFKRSGGTERSCINVVNGLAEDENIEVFLLCTNKEQEKPFFNVSSKVQIVYLNVQNFKLGLLKLYVNVYKAIKKYKIKNVVAVEVYSLLLLFPAFKIAISFGLPVKFIVWEHFNFTVNLGRKLRDYLRKFAAKQVDAIVVLTKRDAELWRSNVQVRGVLTSIPNPSPFLVTSKEYDATAKTIIAIGRLTYQKGFDRLITVWHKFKEGFDKSGNWRLQIIGGGSDKKMLEEKVNQLDMNGSIEFIENTPLIREFYEKAAFLVMTSRFEGLPMTLIEAQAFGLPILAYDCLTGPAEVVTENSGILVKDGDEEKFVLGLLKLTSDAALRVSMSNHSKQEIARFSIKEVSAAWNQLLEKL